MLSPTPDVFEVNANQLEKEEQYYVISDKGRQYLAGELDKSELE